MIKIPYKTIEKASESIAKKISLYLASNGAIIKPTKPVNIKLINKSNIASVNPACVPKRPAVYPPIPKTNPWPKETKPPLIRVIIPRPTNP